MSLFAFKVKEEKPSPKISQDLPADLHYVEEPVLKSFDDIGGSLDILKCGFSIYIPRLSVPVDKEITVKAGICVSGPFSISETYQLISDFVVIVADGVFTKPVKVQMKNCLQMPDNGMEVVTLRADHLNVTEDGFYTFDHFTKPDLFSEHTLSFETCSFCIICNVLDQECSPFVIQPSGPSSCTSLDESNGSHVEFSPSLENLHLADSASLENISLSQKCINKKMKRPRIHDLDVCRCVKKFCRVEYSALIFEPREKVINNLFKYYKFAVFITLNCPGSHEICRSHAQEILETEVDMTHMPIAFDHDSEELLKLDVADISSGWSVLPNKTPTVSGSEVQFHKMNKKYLSQSIDQKSYPPRIIFNADYDEHLKNTEKLFCKVNIQGVSKTNTNDGAFFNINVRPTNTGFHQGAGNQTPPLPSQSCCGLFSRSSQESSFSLQHHGSSLLSHSIPVPPLNHYKERLSPECLERDVPNTVIVYVFKHYIIDWKHTARLGFELEEPEIEHLNSDYRGETSAECGYQAYRKWRMKKGVVSSITALEAIEVFHRAEEFKAIEALIGKLQDNCKDLNAQ